MRHVAAFLLALGVSASSRSEVVQQDFWGSERSWIDDSTEEHLVCNDSHVSRWNGDKSP